MPERLQQRGLLGFRLGEDDLWLTLEGGTESKLCHEGDLHLSTPSASLAVSLQQQVLALWQEQVD